MTADTSSALQLGGHTSDVRAITAPDLKALLDFQTTMSDKKRFELAQASTGTAFSSIVVVAKNKRIYPIVLGVKAKVSDKNGDITPILIGNSSIHPRLRKYRFVPLGVFKQFTVVMEADRLADTQFVVGAAFDQEEAKKSHPFLLPYTPDDKAQYVIAKFPASWGMLYSQTIPTGKQWDTIHSTLANESADAGLWFEAIFDFDKAAHDLIATNEKDLGSLMPKLSRGQHWTNQTMHDVDQLSDDQEDELSGAINKLALALENAAAENLRKQIDATKTSMMASVAPSGIPTEITPARASAPPQDDSTIITTRTMDTSDPAASSSDKYRLAGIMLLLSNHDGISAYGPTFNEDGQALVLCTGVKLRNQMFADSYQDVEQEGCDITSGISMDAAVRASDLPAMKTLQFAQFLGCEMLSTPLTDLKDAKKKQGFTLAYLLQELREAARPGTSHDTQRRNEELLGETSTKLSKVDTSVTCATRIDGLPGITVFFANCQQFFRIMAVVTKSELGTKLPPFLYDVARTFFVLVTDLQFRRRWAEVYPTNRHLPYTLYHQMDTIFCMVVNGARKSGNKRAVTNGNWQGVTDFYAVPRAFCTRAQQAWTDWKLGGITPDGCALFETTDENMELEAQASRDLDARIRRSQGTKRPGALGDTRDKTKLARTIPELATKVSILPFTASFYFLDDSITFMHTQDSWVPGFIKICTAIFVWPRYVSLTPLSPFYINTMLIRLVTSFSLGAMKAECLSPRSPTQVKSHARLTTAMATHAGGAKSASTLTSPSMTYLLKLRRNGSAMSKSMMTSALTQRG